MKYNINTTNLMNEMMILIDNEIDNYFINVQNKIINYAEENKYYNVNMEYLFKETLDNMDFYDLKNSIHILLSDYYNVPLSFDLDIDKISYNKFNESIVKQYKLSSFIIKTTEQSINEIIDKGIISRINNKPLQYLCNNISPADLISKFTNINSKNFELRHSRDIIKRIQGIVINIKYRVKREIKSYIQNNIVNEINVDIKTA